MDKVKCPTYYTEVKERNLKETYVSPYNNQEYKHYGYPNCDVIILLWRGIKI